MLLYITPEKKNPLNKNDYFCDFNIYELSQFFIVYRSKEEKTRNSLAIF